MIRGFGLKGGGQYVDWGDSTSIGKVGEGTRIGRWFVGGRQKMRCPRLSLGSVFVQSLLQFTAAYCGTCMGEIWKDVQLVKTLRMKPQNGIIMSVGFHSEWRVFTVVKFCNQHSPRELRRVNKSIIGKEDCWEVPRCWLQIVGICRLGRWKRGVGQENGRKLLLPYTMFCSRLSLSGSDMTCACTSIAVRCGTCEANMTCVCTFFAAHCGNCTGKIWKDVSQLLNYFIIRRLLVLGNSISSLWMKLQNCIKLH